MAENIVLSVSLRGAETVIPKLTEIDNLLTSIRQKQAIKIQVSAPGLTKAANNAQKLATNLKNAAGQSTVIGNQGAKNLNNAGNAARNASRNAESFNNGMMSVVGTMFKFRLASSAINLVITGFKDAFKEMKAVDSEMVNIRKVTGFAADEIKSLSKDAFALATKYGRSASEVLTGETVFARAGYTSQIEQLGELSLLLQNVGDLQADDAAKFIIATDKAYKLGGSYEKLMEVIDGLDLITNKNATDMQKMTEGMTVAGSVFAESGESIEMFAALLGTATANTQRSGSEMARGLRTIIMNLRQIRGESEDGELIDGESIAAASKALKDYANISTMENGQIRKASDVLAELAGVWDTLTETQRAAIAEGVAGKRQANVLMALMADWESVNTMMGQYENAAGTAARENEIYLDSWEAKTQQIKASWTELINSIIESDTIKEVLTGINNMLSDINDLMDPVGTAHEKTQELQKQYDLIYGQGGEYQNLASRADSLNELERLRLDYLKQQMAIMQDQIKTAKQEEFDTWQREYGSGKKMETSELYWEDGNPVVNIRRFTKDVGDLEDIQNALKGINEQFANDYDVSAYSQGLEEIRSKYSGLRDDLQNWKDMGFQLTDSQETLLQVLTVLDGQIATSQNGVQTYTAAMAAYFLAVGQDAQTAVTNAQNAAAAIGEVGTAAAALPTSVPVTVSANTSAAETKLSHVLGMLSAISGANIDAAVQSGSIYLQGFASGTERAPGGPALVNENGPEVISANGLAWVAGGGKPTITMLPRGATVLTASQSRGLLSGGAIRAYDQGAGSGEEVRRLLGLDEEERKKRARDSATAAAVGAAVGAFMAAGNSRSGSTNWSGGGVDSGPAAPNFKSLEDELSKRLKNLDAQAELAENQEDFLKAMQIYGDAQKYISELLDLYRENGYAEDSDEVLKLANLGYDYASKQLGGYDDLQKRLIDALNALTDATEDANALAERQEAVDKAREALANAERQRTVRIFNPVTGQWEWVANAGDVEKARESLRSAEQALEKEQLDQTISAIKNAKPEDLAGLTLSPAILDKLFNGTTEQQTAFLNALNAATGGADYLGSAAAQTAFNQGNTIGTQYNLNGIELTQEMAAGMSIKQLLDMLRGLQLM